MHAPVLNILDQYEYPMTVLLKIAKNSMTALLKSFDLGMFGMSVVRTTGKEVRPWPDRLLRPCIGHQHWKLIERVKSY